MTLTSDFIAELIKSCLTDRKVLEICKKHLKYQFLFTESQKKVVKYIFETYDLTNTIPTIGSIGQTFATNQEIITLLTKVKRIVVEKDQILEILDTFEYFIRDSKFRILYDKIGDLYNDGKQKEAIELLDKESKEIHDFKLKDKLYTTVFAEYEQRQEKRVQQKDSHLSEKLTFGVHELDDITRGGFLKGTSVLILARSGGFKSTDLRWIGLCNARLGRRVVHFQAEGSEKECLEAYDAGWTSINLHDIEFGILPDSKKAKIIKAQKDILSTGGEIYVYAAETFDSMSINDCRDILSDIVSLYGEVDLVIFDYLEVMTVKGSYGSSESSERKRREDIAQKMTNIAIEFKCGVVTATQAQDISPQMYNNPEFVLTRTHVSEFKNVVKPFSYFLTLNQCDDEYNSGQLRIWIDKLRKAKKPNKPIRIYQSLDNSRFYNAKKTLELLYHPK